MSPEVSKEIQKMVNSCRVCQKFIMLVSRPKITLPKSSTLNEVVTLDLKNFGSKYVLWIIDSFCRFVQGKVIHNKRMDTIVSVITDTWIMCFGKIGKIGCNFKVRASLQSVVKMG